MNILYFRTDTLELVGNKTVTFGGMNATQSEQSVVVYGYKAVVVNNWFWDKDVPEFCKLFKELNNYMGWPDKTSQGCPFLIGMTAMGVEQFEINPQTNEVTSTWSNPDVSCASSIPVVSEKDGTFYCLGKKDGGEFSLESLSWETGKSNFSKPLGNFINPYYAGAELGVNGDLMIGSFFGPVRVSDPKN